MQMLTVTLQRPHLHFLRWVKKVKQFKRNVQTNLEKFKESMSENFFWFFDELYIFKIFVVAKTARIGRPFIEILQFFSGHTDQNNPCSI